MNEIIIDELRILCQNRAIRWTTHVLERLQERNIQPRDVKAAIMSGEVIEQYPTDYPYPSCLVLGAAVSGRWLHVVCGVGDNHIFIITAYYPDPKRWQSDFKTRKESTQ